MKIVIVTDDRYTNREIDHYFVDIKAQLDRIEEQTTKTNGRTTANEKEISNLNTRINTTIWAFGVLVPIIMVLGGMYFVTKLQAIQNSIPQQVSQIIESYRFEVIE